MDYSILFISFFAFIASIYVMIKNIFKKNHIFLNLLLVIFSAILAVLFSIIILVNAGLFPEYNSLFMNLFNFIPVPALAIFFSIAALYPEGNSSKTIPVFIFILIISAINYMLIFNAPLFIYAGLLLNIELIAIIQLTLLLLFIILIPALIFYKIKTTQYLRIKSTLKDLLAGLIIIYITGCIIYAWGAFLLKTELVKNPAIPIPPLFLLFASHHIVYNLKKSNLRQYYIDSIIAVSTFIMLIIPVSLFLIIEQKGTILQDVHFAIKGASIFILMVLLYRATAGLRNKIRYKKYSLLIDKVDQILMSVDDIKHFPDTESFWNTLTKDSISGLKDTMGVTGIYFFLPSRKDGGYNHTFGYGPELTPSFFSFNSKISLFLSSIDDVFEKSYLVTDKDLYPPIEVTDFFNKNNIEIAMSFKSMSGSIIGFLLLGKLNNDEPYTTGHISAFEMYRIKLQNLLITGLILDEVTAEQVEEHDNIVVKTIKKRIMPLNMPVIENIRVSSLNLDNSPDGGDYIDSVKIAKDKISIFISDLEYSGIDSALLGLELFSVFHTRSFIFNSPERVLNIMNQVIKTSRITSKTVHAACAIISSDGDLLYSGTSFNPLIIYDTDRDEFNEIDSTGIPLGSDMNTRYQLTTGKLRDNSIGLIFSKGLLSTQNNEGEFFTLDMVKEIIVKFSRETPAVITREIFEKLQTFTEDRKQLEDISVIIFKKVKADE